MSLLPPILVKRLVSLTSFPHIFMWKNLSRKIETVIFKEYYFDWRTLRYHPKLLLGRHVNHFLWLQDSHAKWWRDTWAARTAPKRKHAHRRCVGSWSQRTALGHVAAWEMSAEVRQGWWWWWWQSLLPWTFYIKLISMSAFNIITSRWCVLSQAMKTVLTSFLLELLAKHQLCTHPKLGTGMSCSYLLWWWQFLQPRGSKISM